jgi:biopolymer transport protein TolR
VKVKRRVYPRNIIPTASMADIAMLLLIFFLSTAIFRSQETMSVRLPGAFTGERIRREDAIGIWIGPDGRVAFNDADVPMDRVAGILAGKLTQNPRLTIALRADARVPYARVVEVLDQLKEARAPRVSFTTLRREAP